MKQEAKGKIFVGMIISIVAFGFATGTGFILGANPLNSSGVLNLTQQSQFPAIPASTHNNVTTTQNSQSSSNQSTTVTPTKNPTNSGNSSNTPTNNNKTSNSSG
jgi:hypothetical protein